MALVLEFVSSAICWSLNSSCSSSLTVSVIPCTYTYYNRNTYRCIVSLGVEYIFLILTGNSEWTRCGNDEPSFQITRLQARDC